MGNNSRTHPPLIIATSDLTKHQKHEFSGYFLNIPMGTNKKSHVFSELICNQFRDHTHKSRLKKLMPLKDVSKQGSENH